MSLARVAGASVVILVALGGLAWLFSPRDPSGPGPAPSDPPEPSERSADRSVPSRDDPLTRRLGEGSVSGHVRGPDSAPIAGATVCALATSELADDLRRFPACTRSGDDGGYRLAGLLAVPQRIVASAPHFLPAAWSLGEGPARRDLLTLAAGQERGGVDLTLRPGGVELRGIVRELSGGIVEGAHVSSGAAHTRSDAEGRFLLWVPPGAETAVRARADGYTDGEAPGVAPGRTFEIALLPEAILRGRVVHGESGAAIAHARVIISAADGHFFTQRGDTTTDEHGRFRVGGLPPGPYKAEVIADEAYGLADAQVYLGVGHSSEPLEIRTHPAHLLIGLATVDGLGTCTKGHVILEPDGPGAPRGATIDAEGLARLRGVLPGPYRLSVACPGAAPLVNEPLLVDQTQTDLRWRLTRGLAVRGRVVDARGRPAPGLWVSDYSDEAAAHAAGALTGEDGAFELSGLLPGEHRLRLSGPGPLPDRPTDVLLPPGSDLDGVELRLPPAGQLRGRVLDREGSGLAGLTVTLQRPDAPALTVTTADDGAYRFDRAPLGPSRLSASRDALTLALAAGATAEDNKAPGRSVTIAADAVTAADLVVHDPKVQLRGVVLDPGGAPVQGALVAATLELGSDPKASRSAARQPGALARLALTDDSGAYSFDDLPAARTTLRATRGDGAEALLTGVTAQTRDKTLRLASPCAVEGVVRLRGAAPERFAVELSAADLGVFRMDMFFRTGGQWSMHALPCGRYDLRVDAPEGAQQLTLELAPGSLRRGVDVALLAKVRVRGQILDLDAAAPAAFVTVKLVPEREGAATAASLITDAEGRFESPPISAGPLTVLISSAELRGAYAPLSTKLTLSADADIFTAPPITIAQRRRGAFEPAGQLGFSLSGQGDHRGQAAHKIGPIRPSTPAARVGLTRDDLLLSIDGHPVTGPHLHLARALLDVPPGRLLTLELAGAGRIELSAE